MDLPSPRIGDVPPAQSPLDAFAMHARMLAKQFDQEQQNGRRMSRLPPHAVQKELSNRPDYFRSVSGESAMSDLPDLREEASPTSPKGLAVTAAEEKDRPMSHYPMFGHASKPSRGSPATTPFYDARETQQRPQARQDYFGIGVPRAMSPEPVDPRLKVDAPSPVALVPSLSNSIDSVQSSQPRTLTNGSTTSQRSLRSERGLLPPKSPGFPRSPRSMQSIRSVPPDSGDEDGSSYTGAYAASSSRKFSGSSNMSRPQSPYSPFLPPVHRSPSATSDYSVNGCKPQTQATQVQRTFNFSRPRSSGGQSIPSVDTRPSIDSRKSPRTSLELPHRHPSGASSSTQPSTTHSNGPSRQGSRDDAPTPYAPEHIESPENGQGGEYFGKDGTQTPGAASYTYAKYSLPRGRTVDRNSIGLSESWSQHQFSWEEEQKKRQSPPTAFAAQMPSLPRPPQRPREDCQTSALSLPVRPSSPTGSVKISGTRLSSRDKPASTSALRSRSANPAPRSPEMPSFHRSSPSVNTESTDKTIRATPLHLRSPSAELTAEEHLETGIQAHSAGQLQKSTYHLRLAARAGLPTAMLLYALACRHGWGMRSNQEEGVSWLRRAISETGGLELIDVEDALHTASQRSPKADPVQEMAERKRRKGQFALAIYELGISYMNGWGCARDKALAVRCYEVAGSWGDADALAEAGFCYTQGVGVKKNLKKAAGLYRRAAEGGMSMAGNSWYVLDAFLSCDGIEHAADDTAGSTSRSTWTIPLPRLRRS